MSKRNAVAYPVDTHEGRMPAGAYFLTGEEKANPAGIWHGCPCGCGLKSYLPFDSELFWTIVKPFPKASLTPSIGMFSGQNPYHWHGYLTDGEFVEC